MKFCPNCGKELAEGSKFCGSCGFKIEAAEPKVEPQPVQQPEKPTYEYNYHQAAPKQKANKGKKPVAIIAVAGVIVFAVMFGVGYFVANMFTSRGTDTFIEEEADGDIELEIPEIEVPELDEVLEEPFDDGDVENGVYTNAWANIKFTVSDKFPEADDSVYDQYDNETAECGFASANTNTAQQFILLYEFVDASLGLGADDYLNIAVKRTESEITASGMTYVTDSYFDYSIAGKNYRVAKLTIEGVVTEYICAYQQDDHIIAMMLTSQSESDITGMLDSITTCY